MIIGAVYIHFKMWMWILIGLNSITKLHGYTDGNFPQACETMLPAHGAFAPQTSAPPFEIELLPNTNPGEPVTVTLKSTGASQFKGFLLEAREAANEARLTGKFVLLEPANTRFLSCGGLEDSAVTQRSNDQKSSVQFNWTATEAEQDIMFRATFVMSYARFWVGVNKTLPQRTTTTTTTPNPTTTSAPTTAPDPAVTTPSSPNTVNTSNEEELAGIALMCFDSILMEGEMAISTIAKILLASEAFYHHLYKVSKIAGNMLCAAVEISSMILLCMGGCCKVTLIALVCVVTVINFAEMVIVSLKIGRSPKVKKSCDIAVRVCFVIHKIFTIAVIFLGVMENDDCGNNVSDSWLLKVMIAFTVWDFLLIIWVVMLSTERTDHLQTNERNKRLRRWKSLRVAEMINITVSVILITGSISFPVAVIVALFTCQKN